MCGIFGIIGRGSSKIDISRNLESIARRGPDDVGEYFDENIHLGFRRLSVIDLSSSGHQPMSDDKEKIWLIFNGEIYNFLELKKELDGYFFNSATDTEVLIYGYKKWGIAGLLSRINGMFAFCLYDKKENVSYLVRDRIGKKPLYYYEKNGLVSFSSETKAFFHLKDFNFEIEREALDLFMGFSYMPDNKRTIIKNVFKVSPGSYIKIKDGKLEEKKYWSLPGKNVFSSFDEAKNKLEYLLTDSIKKRLIADVPIGVLLSGGLDSSLITALASKYSQKQINTINISFKNSSIDEKKYARKVANHCNTNHHELTLDVGEVYDKFKGNIEIFDDLSTVDGGLFSTFLISQKVKELGIKVVLVGEGADEIFGGYSWFQFSKYPFRMLPNFIKASGYYYAIMRSLPGINFFKYARILGKKLEETKRSFFYKVQEYEIKYSLPNHYCMKVDKGASAASIEARAPYMDYRIVELANGMDENFMIKGSFFNKKMANEKHILRKIAEKYLPLEICERKKLGGMLPTEDILNDGLEKDSDLILKNKFIVDFFGKGYLEKMISNNTQNKFFRWQREWTLWKCLIFAVWFDYFNKYGKN
jgi:asparagine synthase (glutamine-hydrolysing)